MAHDPQMAEDLRAALEGRDGLSEKRMFGGLCFLLHGNMTCVASADHGMFRVGRDAEAEALAIDGVTPMLRTGRRMPGFVEADADCMADPGRRAALLSMAIAHVDGLPPK